ncbi:MAG: hypothetical protein QOJ00_968 [Actinomycetota bacterium]
MVLALLGFLLVTAAQSASATKVAEQPRKEQLISLIQERRSTMKVLDKAVRNLRGQLAGAQRRSNNQGNAAADAARSEAVLAAQAGASAITGPGLRVKASDSKTTPDDTREAGAYLISDTDLQLLVNALWSAGAEAVAINGNRIVATSSIRAAGETIVVNFRPLSPPYRLDAIGADATVFSRSDIATRMRRWHTLFGLGFSTRDMGALSIPAYAGRVGIDVATPGAP